VAAETVLGRFGTTLEVARAVEYLLSEDAGFAAAPSCSSTALLTR